MGNRYEQAFYTDPDCLAEGFLHAGFIWDSGEKSLVGDYTLRNWRDEFYRWDGRAYNRVSDAEMKRLVKRYLHEFNGMSIYSYRESSQYFLKHAFFFPIFACSLGK